MNTACPIRVPGRWRAMETDTAFVGGQGFCRPSRGWLCKVGRNPALTRWAIICRPSGPGATDWVQVWWVGFVSLVSFVESLQPLNPPLVRDLRMLQPLRGCFCFSREPGVRFATPYRLKSLRDRGNKPKDLCRNRKRRGIWGSIPIPSWTLLKMVSGWRCPHRQGNSFGTATRTSPARPWNGGAMSSSPWEGSLGNGDEDVASPCIGLET